METVRQSPTNANYCIWLDTEASPEPVNWEFNYIVGQNDGEHDKYVYRQFGRSTWHDLPPFATPPPQVEEFFHGPLSTTFVDQEMLAGRRLGLLNAIFRCIDGKEWNGDTVVQISEEFQKAGWASPKDFVS